MGRYLCCSMTRPAASKIPVQKSLASNSTGERVERMNVRFRSLGCYPCTGAVASHARNVAEIIAELTVARHSERGTRIIDHDQDGSMEQKKREGYF